MMRSLKRLLQPVAILCILVYCVGQLLPGSGSLGKARHSQWRSSTTLTEDQLQHRLPPQGSWQKELVNKASQDDSLNGKLPSNPSPPLTFSVDMNHRAPIVDNSKLPIKQEKYPMSTFQSVPTGRPAQMSKIQTEFKSEDSEAKALRQSRLAAVREACTHSLNGYLNNAWLRDEVAPVTGGYRTTLGGWALTLVDSLDLMWIIGMEEEFEKATRAVDLIDFQTPDGLPLNVFETTIRYLGGLISAYDVSDGKFLVLLKKAVEVGDMLHAAFDTPNRMPLLHWRKLGVEVASGETLLAELGSMTLEFTRLSVLTGDMKYYDSVQRITDHFETHQNRTKLPGMWPTTVNAREVDMSQGMTFTLAGTSDSMYEYLAKEHLLLGGRTNQYEAMYGAAIDTAQRNLFFKPMNPTESDILLSGTAKVWRSGVVELLPQMSHLTCFAGGMLALGAKLFDRANDMEVARKLVNGCIWAYRTMPSSIMPETFHAVRCPSQEEDPCSWDEEAWGRDMIARNSNDDKAGDKQLPLEERIALKAERLRLPKGVSAIGSRQYLLRPEAIESMFILYRITGDESLREEAWAMFQAITEQTRTDIAFSSIDDVTTVNSRKLDRMESYWTAETLKYFYLIFSTPDVVSLDKYVFNTEGHPFVIGYDEEEVVARSKRLT